MNLHDKNKLKSTVLELNRFSIDNAINHDPGISIEEYILTQRFHQLTEIEEYKYLYRLSNGFTDTNKILQDISYLSFIYGIEWEQPFITEVEERIKNVLNQGLRSDIIYNPTKLTITWEDFSYIEKEFILAWAMYRDETGKDRKSVV